jgi:hypothetical protein
VRIPGVNGYKGKSATPVTLSYALINAAQDCEIVFFYATIP